MTSAVLRIPATRAIADQRLLLRFIRLRNAKLPLAVYVGLAATIGVPVARIAMSSVLLVLAYGFVVVFNDITDAAGDRLNERDLPLATGEISPRRADHILAGLGLGVISMTLMIGTTAAASITASVTLAGFLYSAPRIRLSDHWLTGPVLLAVCYVDSPLMFAVAQAQTPVPHVATTALATTCLAVGTVVYKDFGDESGDAAIGKRTLLVRRGPGAVHLLALTFHSLGLTTAALVIGAGVWVLPAGLTLISSVSLWGFGVRPRVLYLHRMAATAAVVAICVQATASAV